MIKGIAKGLIVAALGLAFVAKPAHAQKPGLEFGTQLVNFSAMNPEGSGNNLTSFGIGSGWAMPAVAPLGSNANISVGYYLNPQIAIEPTLIFAHFKTEGSSNATTLWGLTVGVPIYLNKGWGKAGGLFVEPFAGLGHFSAGPGSSGSQNHFGANLGTKMKIKGSSNLFWRIQAGYDKGIKNTTDGIPAYSNISASFGLSAYLH